MTYKPGDKVRITYGSSTWYGEKCQLLGPDTDIGDRWWQAWNTDAMAYGTISEDDFEPVESSQETTTPELEKWDRVIHPTRGEGVVARVRKEDEVAVIDFPERNGEGAYTFVVALSLLSKVEPQKCEHSPLEEEFRMVIRGEFDDFLGQAGDLSVESDRDQLICSIAQRLAEEVASTPELQIEEESDRVKAIREFVAQEDEQVHLAGYARILDFIDNGPEPLRVERDAAHFLIVDTNTTACGLTSAGHEVTTDIFGPVTCEACNEKLCFCQTSHQCAVHPPAVLLEEPEGEERCKTCAHDETQKCAHSCHAVDPLPEKTLSEKLESESLRVAARAYCKDRFNYTNADGTFDEAHLERDVNDAVEDDAWLLVIVRSVLALVEAHKS